MSTDLKRDLHVLISIAKVDAAINENRKELVRLPRQMEKARKSLADIDGLETDAKANIEDMTKERRALEEAVEDNAVKVTRYKTQLMEVKTNKEYTAMLHEIDHVEKDTDEKEERLLILMDELDQREDENTQYLEQSTREKQALNTEQSRLEVLIKELQAETEKLQAEKPKLLLEVNPQIKKRYDRLLAKLGDFAVTHVDGDTCHGCFTRIPPQVLVEVRRNDQLITCEACGRMLVYYDAQA